MKTLGAVIIDDEASNVELLEHYLKKYCAHVSILGTANSSDEAIELINEKKPQLLFLDIHLGENTAFDILDAIDYTKHKVIFVTGFNEYAIKAFKYNAIDYILKPIKIEELVAAVSKSVVDIEKDMFTSQIQLQLFSKTLNDKNHILDFIAISSTEEIDIVKLENILYLESEGRYTTFYKKDATKVLATKNMGEYESILPSKDFFRIHNTYMVNLNYIVKIGKTDGNFCEMVNGKTLPISRRRNEELIKLLNIR